MLRNTSVGRKRRRTVRMEDYQHVQNGAALEEAFTSEKADSNALVLRAGNLGYNK